MRSVVSVVNVLLVVLVAAGCGDGDGGDERSPTSTPSATSSIVPTPRPTLGAGDLDPTFGTAGVVTIDLDARLDIANGIAIQTDGKILVGGTSHDQVGNADFALARCNVDGSLDRTFGDGHGIVVSEVGGFAEATAVALLPTGKIAVAGSVTTPERTDWIVVSYTADGRLDQSFGTGGLVRTAIAEGATATAIATQSDGKLVVVGDTVVNSDFAVARYTENGSLDPTFGHDGVVTTNVRRIDDASSVVLQPDGKIIVGGGSRGDGTTDFTVVRYLSSGSGDGTFGPGAIVVTDITPGRDSAVAAVALQPDRKIVAAGPAGLDFFGHFGPPGSFGLVRYDPDGTLDPLFGTGGTVTTTFGTANTVRGLAVQSDGKLVVVGSAIVDVFAEITLLRYDANGALDVTFGDGGIATVQTQQESEARAVALQPDGEIVAAGYVRTGSSFDFIITRHLSTP